MVGGMVGGRWLDVAARLPAWLWGVLVVGGLFIVASVLVLVNRLV